MQVSSDSVTFKLLKLRLPVQYTVAQEVIKVKQSKCLEIFFSRNSVLCLIIVLC